MSERISTNRLKKKGGNEKQEGFLYYVDYSVAPYSLRRSLISSVRATISGVALPA